jgi:membrane protein YdbS with pleckstrin-like domain
MSWTSILTALVLATVSAIMVIVYEFEPWQAFLMVGSGAVAVILGLLLILLPPSDHREVWLGFKCEFRKEYQAILMWLRKK